MVSPSGPFYSYVYYHKPPNPIQFFRPLYYILVYPSPILQG